MSDFVLTTLMYHYVREPGDRAEAGSGIPGLSPQRFEAQVDYLARHYTMIAWPDLRAHLLGQRELPRNACLLTFDDGVSDHYLNVFPLLRERGLSGLFFILARAASSGMALGHKIHFLLARLGVDGLRAAVRARLDQYQLRQYAQAEARYRARAGESAVELLKLVLQRDLSAPADAILSELFAEHVGVEAQVADRFYLTDGQIAEMTAGGMHIGGHSRSHPWLDFVSAEEQASEIDASAAWLRARSDGPYPFAYPYGGFSAESTQLLRSGGFAAAFTTIAGTRHGDPLLIGRLDGDALPHPPIIGPSAAAARY
jgi:peptidoglycan/xylan/chitin deacetylase (PgdA/CDA1 family)